MRCPECDDVNRTEPDRREFLKTVTAGSIGLATTAALPGLHSTAAAMSKPTGLGASETLVATLYKSLTPQQQQVVAFPFDHPLRSKVDNNWHITTAKVGEFFTPDQQAMIEEIFRKLHNPDFVDKVLYHINEDAGGLKNYSIALFGNPGSGAFEFVLTGRHCTARCDGESTKGAAFGGPIFYGHASQGFNEKPDHPGNIYWYQAKRANEVFQALDPKQRQMALLGNPREERGTETVSLTSAERSPGLPVSEMSRDQKRLVREVLHDLLMPFREQDRKEALKDITADHGLDALSMSYYKNMDIGQDGVWDVWQLESPTMIWYFRGAPHVHVWVNVQTRG
jgi:hypothetical protein